MSSLGRRAPLLVIGGGWSVIFVEPRRWRGSSFWRGPRKPSFLFALTVTITTKGGNTKAANSVLLEARSSASAGLELRRQPKLPTPDSRFRRWETFAMRAQ